MNTSITAAHANTSAVGLITKALELAWGTIENSIRLEDASESSEPYTGEVWSACQRLREAGEALEAAANAAAERLGVDMLADVLQPLEERHHTGPTA